jgi:hypothetical protein
MAPLDDYRERVKRSIEQSPQRRAGRPLRITGGDPAGTNSGKSARVVPSGVNAEVVDSCVAREPMTSETTGRPLRIKGLNPERAASDEDESRRRSSDIADRCSPDPQGSEDRPCRKEGSG